MIDIKYKAVFISGPMSGIDNYNVAAFCEAHARMKALGPMYVYKIPRSNTCRIARTCPTNYGCGGA